MRVKIEIKPIFLQVVLNHNIRLWKFMVEISWNLFHTKHPAPNSGPGTPGHPGIRVIYLSICFIWSTICGVVGFSAFALRKKSLAALNSLLFIMMLHICR
jgi:hypothetical protein